jgi:hypothetical protein
VPGAHLGVEAVGVRELDVWMGRWLDVVDV